MSIKVTASFQMPQYLQEIINLYTLYSDLECTEENLKVPFSVHLKPIMDMYEVGAKKALTYNLIDYPIVPVEYSKNNNVVVCCSGGKDSTAVAIKLKEENYNVCLYYVKGINKSYPEEEKRIAGIAEYLQVPYYIDKRFKFSGHSDFPDNPVKNQLILSMALNYAHESGNACKIAFGDFNQDTIAKCDFMTSWSDTIEMQTAYQSFIKHYVPDFEYIAPFNSEFDSINIINTHYEILPLTQSCITPYRFRNKLKTCNEEKYKMELPANRCGSCYKCCREYIHFHILGRYDLNQGFYKHCLDIFKKTLKKQHPEFLKIDNKVAYEYYIKLPYEELK